MLQLRRLRNGLAKVAAGLTPFGESVWPGVRNDLFVAHESIYLHFATLAKGMRILDAGCGCGYGANILAEAGAASILAVDIDRRNIRYANRHYAHPAITFSVADCERLTLAPASLDLAESSNMLEHLGRPDAFLSALHRALRPNGRVVLALPPITYPEALSEHNDIHYHRSNLTVDQWLELFQEQAWSVTVFAHRYPADPWLPNFRSYSRSRLRPEDFSFSKATRDILYADPPITAVYTLSHGAV